LTFSRIIDFDDATNLFFNKYVEISFNNRHTSKENYTNYR
jgi:hypothetical protein